MILVTAAGGKTGRQLIARLQARGEAVRALARSELVHQLRAHDVTTLAGDMLDPATLEEAFDGVTAVAHIGPTANQHEVAMGVAVADAALARGVDRFVLLSVAHPQLEYLINHQNKLRVEDYVVTAGLPYTIVQPMHYLQNVEPARVVSDGALRLPYSVQRRLSFVDLADVAEACAMALTEDGHRYATYPLCGPDLLSGEDVATIIAEESGTTIAAESIPLAAFLGFVGGQVPLGSYQRAYLTRLMTYYDAFGITGNPNVLRWLLGREPGTMRGYVRRALDAAAAGQEPEAAGSPR